MDEPGTGPRVAIKDLIDVVGTPTTAACRVLAAMAEPADPGRRLPGAAAGGRRRHRRQGQPARAGLRRHRREPALRHAGEPVRPRLHPRRQLQRQRGGAGGRRGRHRHRQRHGRVDPQPVGVLRHRRAQDDLGPHPARRRVAAGPVARHARPDGARRRRHHRRHGAAGARLRGRGRTRAADRSGPPARRRPRHRRGRRRRARRVRARGRRRRRCPGWDAAGDAGWAVMFHEYWVVDHHLYERDPGRPGRRHRRAHGAGPRRHRRRLRSRRAPTGPSGAPSWRPPSTGPRCWPGPPSPCSRRRSTAPCPTPAAPTCP